MGRWGTGAALLGAGVALVASGGCASGRDAIETRNPEAAFAPLIVLGSEERWLPMSATWLIQRSALRWAVDHACPDLKVAVGRTLRSQRTARTDWIYIWGLGRGPAYERYATDPDCEIDAKTRYFADERTRPHDTADRPGGLPRTEGFYLDLVDSARAGPPANRRGDGAGVVDSAAAYVEQTAKRVDGGAGLRLTYWFLYGRNQPSPHARAAGEHAHEGDWERLDVLIRRGADPDSYVPVAVRVFASRSRAKLIPWGDLPIAAADEANGQTAHPVLVAAPGSHELSPSPSAGGRPCGSCLEWPTWTDLRRAHKQTWYGFGGAWGEKGPSRATTGPLGPHGHWPTDRDEYR